MFQRDRPIRQRLNRAFGLFSGILLLLVWLLSLAYFFIYERNERLEALRTQGAMLAAQSTAAVVFDDRVVLAENLAALRHMRGLRWVAIVTASTAERPVAAPVLLAGYGAVPDNLAPYLTTATAIEPEVNIGLTDATLRQTIQHNGYARAELLLGMDQRADTQNFFWISVFSLMLYLLFFIGATKVFNRTLLTLLRPIGELAQLANRVGESGLRTEQRAVSGGNDEVGQLATAFNRMLDKLAMREADLAQSRDALRALSARLQAVREEERTRIAHEIHDELGQRMTAFKFEVARLTEGAVREHLGGLVDGTIQTVRHISWELRPSVLDSLGLVAAIEWQAKDFQQRMGMRCVVDLPEVAVTCPDELATDLFRICQELLTNISRHAQASRVDIRLSVDAGGAITLEVRDNGVGIPAICGNPLSLGLLGIRERARRWGGDVDIRTRPALGTAVCVKLPPPPQQCLGGNHEEC